MTPLMASEMGHIRRPSTAPPDAHSARHFLEMKSELYDLTNFNYSGRNVQGMQDTISLPGPPYHYLHAQNDGHSPTYPTYNRHADLPTPPDTAGLEISGKGAAPIKISRPPNAWILYRSDKLVELKEANASGRTPQAELSKQIAERWRAEPADVKKRYEQMAEQRKLEHDLQYPDYKFKPKRKIDNHQLGRVKQARAARTRSATAPVSTHSQFSRMISLGSPSLENYIASAPATSSYFSSETIPIFEGYDDSGPQLYGVGQYPNQPVPGPSSASWMGDPSAASSPDYVLFTGYSEPTQISSLPAFEGQSNAEYTGQMAVYDSHLTAAPDYAFPARPPPKPTNSYNSYVSSASSSIPTSSSQMAADLPAWWPFRNVKVSKDDENGQELQSLLQDLAEEAGMASAREACLAQSIPPSTKA